MGHGTSKLSVFFVLSFILTACASQPFRSPAGGEHSGGGNTVGDELFDDYEAENSIKIPSQDVEKLAAPYLSDLDKRMPGLAVDLRKGITGIVWYYETKPLRQNGDCFNESPIDSGGQQVVRACQSLYDVRIDKKWADDHADLLRALVVHELLVYQKLHVYKDKLSEQGLFATSREIRNLNPKSRMSFDELNQLLLRAGFGATPYYNVTGLKSFISHVTDARDTVENQEYAHVLLCSSYTQFEKSKVFTTHTALCNHIDLRESDWALVNALAAKNSEDYWFDVLANYMGFMKRACADLDYPICDGWNGNSSD